MRISTMVTNISADTMGEMRKDAIKAGEDTKRIERSQLMKYRKKPVYVEVWKFDTGEEMPNWVEERISGHCSDGSLLIGGFGGLMMSVNEGDYIVKENDIIHPCKPDIFEQKYEPVEKGEDNET